jgi:hypothetical protein
MPGNGKDVELSAIVESYRNGMPWIDGGEFETSEIFGILHCMVSAFIAPAFPSALETWAGKSHRNTLTLACDSALQKYMRLEIRVPG